MKQDVSQWLMGENINWLKHWDAMGVQRIQLTAYPFEQQHYWFNVDGHVNDRQSQTSCDQQSYEKEQKEQKVEKMLQDVIDGHMDLDDIIDSVGNV